jgi:HK97 family phage major capsid protein
MNQILALREKRAKAWEDAKAFLDSKRGSDGMLSAEDTAAYEKMEAEVVNLGKEVERLERREALDREMAAVTTQPLTTRPGQGNEQKAGRATDAYRDAFWNQMRNRSSYEVRNALQIGMDSEGGVLAPDEYERTLITMLEEENVLRTLCRTIRTASGDRKIPLVASKGTASWVDEEGAIPDSDDSFGLISIGAHKVATMIKVSDELLNDSVFDIEGYIASEFGRRIGTAEEQAFLTGNGSGKPTGLLHDTLGAEVGVTAAAAAAMTSDELIDLIHSLRAPYRRKATFIMNDGTVKLIRKLKDNSGQYLWQPGLKEGQPDTLLNYKIVNSAFMPAPTAGNKSVLFGDLSYYWIADRQGRSFQRLNELFAQTGQVGFRATQRVDGRLILPEAVKVLQMKAA